MLPSLNVSTLRAWVANRGRTTISFLGSKEDARKYAMEGDMQIDDLMTTSPVGKGGSMEAGAAPMSGKSEFSNERTRTKQVGNMGGMRREFPVEGVSEKSGL